MCADRTLYERLPSNAQKQVSSMLHVSNEVLEGKVPALSLEQMAAAALNTRNLSVTEEWEIKCRPIAEWVGSRPELAWFVETERVAREGWKTSQELRPLYPNATQEEFLGKMYAVWHSKLLAFAMEHGYQPPNT